MLRRVATTPLVILAGVALLGSVLAGPATGADARDRAEPAAAAAPGQTLYGVHQDLTFQGNAAFRSEAVAAARDTLNAQVSRNSLLWDKIEPRRGQRDWSVTDAVVEELENAGIEPLFAIYGSPSWANGVGPEVADHELYVPRTEPEFTTWLTHYREFVRAAVERYRGRITHWELWNEPNEGYFWRPHPSPDRYARFYREIRRVILEVDPEAQVAVGGLPGAEASVNLTAVSFLSRLRELGIRPDIVAVHAYPGARQPPERQRPYENDFVDLERVYQEAARGNPDVQIWLTEWGWSTEYVDPATQAEFLGRSLELIATRYQFITLATVFMDHDRPPAHFHGLLDSNLRPKPAAGVFARFVASQQG